MHHPHRFPAALLALALPLLCHGQAPTLQGPTTISGQLSLPADSTIQVQSGAALNVAAGATVSLPDAALDVADVAGLQTALDLKLPISTAASSYQPLDSDLTSIAALTTTSFGRDLLTTANQAGLASLLPNYLGSVPIASSPIGSGLTLFPYWSVSSTVFATQAGFRTALGLSSVASSGSASDLGSGTLAAARLPASGVGAGTYRSVTVDTTGRVTAGTNPTTYAGYGITDVQPLSSELTFFAGMGDLGLIVRANDNTSVTRRILGTSGQISVANDDAIEENPVISLPSSLILPGHLSTHPVGTITAGAALTNSPVLAAGTTSSMPVVTTDGTQGVLNVYAGTIFGARIHSQSSNGITVSSQDGQAAKFVQSGTAVTTNIPVVRIHRTGSASTTSSPLLHLSDAGMSPTTGGALLKAVKGTTTVLFVDSQGRLILRAPGNGTYWRLNVSDTGVLSTTSVPSP